MKKKCKICKEEKEWDEFHNCSKSLDGKRYECKECQKKEWVKWKNKNKENYNRKRREKTFFNAVDNSRYVKYRNENPEKYKCKYIVNNAIQSGKIIKQPCNICGEIKSEAHHSDYTKPLEVVWLCHNHHMEIHNGELRV